MKICYNEYAIFINEKGVFHMRELIESGKAVLGLELGSTRIKAVLIVGTHKPIATGGYEWENQLVNGIWTYDLKEA